MRIVHKPDNETVRAARRQAYLDACPITVQLEALYEAMDGRPEKLEQVKEKIESIRHRMRKERS